MQNLESFNVKTFSYFPFNDSVGLIVGKTASQGQFNIWNLMISEGFVNFSNIELAFKHCPDKIPIAILFDSQSA
ncbi:hypothetical protein [Nostoc sp. ChiQUE01b]|uniref:hypothetical protein n=1 Tax=Nostoc sp. ChiQUE01b TaxID=3075376 RepID=UPI002AD45CE0|nr:hypothetical protein [Nostoc sp. ChiQUE01b]